MLELRGVSKRYGSVQALDECAFRAATGRLTGFVGPNGAGKTTAMRVIFGLVSPDSGEARWNGRAIDANVRRRFGYMPEERGLYPRMRVRDQLLFFGRLSGLSSSRAGMAADRWLDALGLTDRQQLASTICPTGISKESSWPRPWYTIRRCSSSMSRSPGSIPSRWTRCSSC